MFKLNIILVLAIALIMETSSYLLKVSTMSRLSFAHIHATTSIEEGVQKPYSFVQDELRSYAMKLHTRDQAPKEGQQKAETPFTKWEPERKHYMQFLVDSLVVYETLENLVQITPELAAFKSTGLERSEAIKSDLKWMCEFDKTLTVPGIKLFI